MSRPLPDHLSFHRASTGQAIFSGTLVNPEMILKIAPPVHPVDARPIAPDSFLQRHFAATSEDLLRLTVVRERDLDFIARRQVLDPAVRRGFLSRLIAVLWVEFCCEESAPGRWPMRRGRVSEKRSRLFSAVATGPVPFVQKPLRRS